MLFPLDTLADVVGLPPAGEGFRGTVNAIVTDTDDSAREILSAVLVAGGKQLCDLTPRDWGSRTAYFSDPEHNVWEVAVLPGVTFDDRGAVIWPSA